MRATALIDYGGVVWEGEGCVVSVEWAQLVDEIVCVAKEGGKKKHDRQRNRDAFLPTTLPHPQARRSPSEVLGSSSDLVYVFSGSTRLAQPTEKARDRSSAQNTPTTPRSYFEKTWRVSSRPKSSAAFFSQEQSKTRSLHSSRSHLVTALTCRLGGERAEGGTAAKRGAGWRAEERKRSESVG